ncbi:MAG: DUF4857 domain-containing protein, partial [Paludibacteraceae bacterium]|nr:DUF4857 domain-containing protein [Paludibacteraceae bacterium]
FPVQLIWCNGTTLKDYDNGFLLTDANNRLFHLKMVKGTPWVREINTSVDMTSSRNNDITSFIQLFTLEPANRQLIGLVVSDDYRLFAVRSDGTIAQIGANSQQLTANSQLIYDPQSMQISIVGDLFHWTITEYTATDSRYYAVDARTFEQVACAIIPDPERPLNQRIERILLPVRLRFTSWRTQLIAPNINDD